MTAAQGGDIPHGTNMEHAVRLQVRDNGPGIPPEALGRAMSDSDVRVRRVAAWALGELEDLFGGAGEIVSQPEDEGFRPRHYAQEGR